MVKYINFFLLLISVFSLFNVTTESTPYTMPKKRRGGSIGRSTPTIKKQKKILNIGNNDSINDSQPKSFEDPHTAENIKSKKIHHEVGSFKCDDCEKTFGSNFNLQRHIKKLHMKERSFKCTLCNISFNRSYNLERHLEAHKAQNDLKFKCTECNKSFSRKDILEMHMKTHFAPKESKFYCTECDRCFLRKDLLQ